MKSESGTPKWPEPLEAPGEKRGQAGAWEKACLGWWVRELGADQEPRILDRVLSVRLCIALEEVLASFEALVSPFVQKGKYGTG